MGARGLVGLACVGMLLWSACGRIGFELLGGDGQPQRRKKAAAAGSRDAQVAGADSGMPGTAFDASAGASDARADSSPIDAAMNAASKGNDAGSGDAAGGGGGSSNAGACTANAVADYCTELPRLPVVPKIDGQLECDLVLRDITPMGWTNSASPIPAGHLARFAAAWRADGIYFFLDVTDDTRLPAPAGSDVWCGDGPELYADSDGTYAAAPMYDAPGTIQLLATAPPDDSTVVSSGGIRYRAPNSGLVGPWSSPRYAAFPKPGGYVFEAFIEADDLDLTSWTLVAGGAVGLDIAINLSVSSDPPPATEMPGCGRRLGQYFLRMAPAPCTTACQPFASASAFCAPLLRE